VESRRIYIFRGLKQQALSAGCLSLMNSRLLWFLFCCAFAYTCPALAAQASTDGQKRVALVIGNADYMELGQELDNPVNDSNAISESLRNLGIEVIEATDLDYLGMRKALRSFDRALQGADVGLFFYAGHGMEYDGKNYLFPTDAILETEGDVSLGLIDMDQILRVMEKAVPTRLVFLDACRNNPLARSFRGTLGASRSAAVGRGLGRIDAAVGTFIAFATAPGEIAVDGKGRNSPFTKAIVEHLPEPGLEISQLMLKVRNSVIEATDEKQVPWETSSLRGPLILNLDITITPPSSEAPSAMDMRRRAETVFWESIKDSDQLASFEAYMDRFGENGLFAPLALGKIKALNDQASLVLLPRPKPRPNRQVPVTKHKPGEAFKDCPSCPEMVVIPSGEFEMGGHRWLQAVGQWQRLEEPRENELPVRQLTIQPFALGRYEVKREEYATFLAATNRDEASGDCAYWDNDKWLIEPSLGWDRPGFEQDNSHPVTCISWSDAQAYVDWLTQTTGHSYRLPSEAEWEYACRGGTGATFATGASLDVEHARFNSEDTLPVGSFSANPFGLHDMHGNVWEWVEDRYHENYAGAPMDGSAWLTGDRPLRVHRGGDFDWNRQPIGNIRSDGPSWLRCASRSHDFDYRRMNRAGLRVARSLEPR